MNTETAQTYIDAGWSRHALARIDEIVHLINKLPLSTKEQAEELFSIMMISAMTENEDEAWKDGGVTAEEQEEEKRQWEEANPEEEEKKGEDA